MGKRDYAAEYARRKARAQRLGYGSVRGLKRARKTAGLSRSAPTPPRRQLAKTFPVISPSFIPGLSGIKQLRNESQRWSDLHSRKHISQYDDSWDDERVRRYHEAFVAEHREASSKKRKVRKSHNIYEYIEHYFPDYPLPEWSETWKSDPP